MKKLFLSLVTLFALVSCALPLPSESVPSQPTTLTTSENSSTSNTSDIETTTSEPSIDPTSEVTSTTSSSEITTNTSTSEITSTQPTTSPTIPEEETFYNQYYQHVWKTTDIPNLSGGKTNDINGLTWTYSAHNYKQDNPKGVQIGSKNKPQTTPFTLKTSFPFGVSVTSVQLEVAVASGGSSTFTIQIGSSTKKTSNFSSTDVETFSYTDLDISAQSITFSFTASQKALYLYSIAFGLKVSSKVNLEVGTDEDIAFDPVEPGKNGIPNINYSPISKEEYYEDTNLEVEGNYLVNNLRLLISTMTKTSYDDAKYMLQYTDESTAKPGYLYGMYDGDYIPGEWVAGNTWNREHVWPCAKMQLEDQMRPSASTKNHTSDLHNLRAACPTVNGYHSDKYYGETNDSTTMYPNITSEISGKHAFTGDFRGDVARIMFYMYVRYDGLLLTDDLNPNSIVSMGKLSLFIEWHNEDPVDSFETRRNERIYAYQGNRNPFIDYPELVNKLF